MQVQFEASSPNLLRASEGLVPPIALGRGLAAIRWYQSYALSR